MTVAATLTRLADLPLIPDGDEAREWAERELADPAYREAEPTFFDRAARAVAQFIERLFSTQVSGEWGLVLALIVTGIVVLLIVVAFLVWGMPRSTRRLPAARGVLFGETDDRSAAELRAAAASHASKQEWDAAIVLRFRALARGLHERGVVETPPGTTVHGFARAASAVFPASAAPLEAAATAFDDVRYLRRPGTRDLYARVADVDDALRAARAPIPETAAANA
ncbi:DUF4129 domain-containing protein [Microbacterium sp. NPDC055910]|uniref:DUF4129 domain-containing protein n=1 Tax=Microbacterium sp. NPDC055910 TaxID=3345659 RepID=UPI0035E2A99A